MLDIYLAPRQEFTRLKEKRAWLVPLIIVVVASMLTALVASRYVDWTEQRDKAVERMRERNMTEEQIERATAGLDRIFGNPLIRYGGPMVNGLFMSALGILVIALIYNVCLPLLGAPGSFVRTLTVVANAALATVPGALLRIALHILTRSDQASTSLAAVLPWVKKGFFVVILSRIDPFIIWQLFLAGLGLNVMFDLKGSKSYWLVFSVWAVTTLILALLGGRMAGR